MPEQNFEEFSDKCTGSGEGAIVGDSYAAALASFLSLEYGLAQYTASGCPPALKYSASDRPHCERINEYFFDMLFLDRPTYVLLHANWIAHWSADGFQNAFRETNELLIAHGIQPIVIGQVPDFSPSIVELALAQRISLNEGQTLRLDLGSVREVNFEIDALVRKMGAQFWDPVSALCDENDVCLAVVKTQTKDVGMDEATLIAWDDGHLTFSGAQKVGETFLADIDALKP